jgi:putative iron-regulated protein
MLADQIDQAIQSTLTAIQAIPQPFEQAIVAAPASPDHMKVDAAVQTFVPIPAMYRQMAADLGIVINL